MKNKLRKMLSLVLSVVIAMSAISLNTFAATIMNIVNGSNQKLYVDWYDYSYNFNGRLNTSTYCFKSFNDLADELNIKRDTAMKIVSNLVNLHLVRKQRKMRYDNRKVYADNSYSLKVIKLIKKRNKPGLHSGLISFKNILKHTDNPTITELNSLRNYNNAIGSICQVGQGDYSVIFLKNRGSPRNLRSIQYPVILPSERQNIFYIRI